MVLVLRSGAIVGAETAVAAAGEAAAILSTPVRFDDDNHDTNCEQ